MTTPCATTCATTQRSTARWWVVDASQEVLGRMATRIARILQGKHRPTYTPHADTGDFVVVVNAEKVQVTGRKASDKVYRYYTGNHGGLVEQSYSRMLDRHPTDIIKLAVRRMLPKTDLGRHMLKKLKLFAGPTHTHHAQGPEPLAFHTTKAGRKAQNSKKAAAKAS
jgi:large subunit ribosomal protein L13